MIQYPTSFQRAHRRFAPLATRLVANGSVAAMMEVLVNGLLLLLAFRVVIGATSLATFGIWALIQSLTGIVKMADVGVAGSLPRFIGRMPDAERRDGVWRYVDTAVLFNVAFYIVLAAIAYLPLLAMLKSSLPGVQEPVAERLLPFVLVTAILSSIASVPVAALVGLRRGSIKSLINMAGSTVLLVMVVVLTPRFALLGLVLAQAVQQAFLFAAGWVVLTRTLNTERWLRLRPVFQMAVIRETVALSALMQVNTAMAQLYDVCVRLLLTTYGGTASTAVFELVERVLQPVRVLLLGPIFLGVPVLARAFAKRVRRTLRRVYERQVLLTFVAASGIYVIAIVAAPIVQVLLLRGDPGLFYVFFLIDWAATFLYVLCIPAMLLGPASGKLARNLLANAIMLSGVIGLGSLAGRWAGPTAVLATSATILVATSVLAAILNGRRFGIPLLPRRSSVARIFRPGGYRQLFSPILR